MSKTFTTITPPADAEIRQVIIHYQSPTKPFNIMSVQRAADLGLVTFETDSRGYVQTVVSLEGEEGFPEDVLSVRPTGKGAGNGDWVPQV